jgi:hypothetical protein
MKRIAVYCGSNPCKNPVTRKPPNDSAPCSPRKDWTGLRRRLRRLDGTVANNAALKNGGHVIGVMPEKLVIKEVIHDGFPDSAS